MSKYSVAFGNAEHRRELLGSTADTYRLRAALCDYCDGCGFVHQVDGEHVAITMTDVPHKAALPGIEPCFDCEPCPECGRLGCGPGVRWVEVTP
jgi:ferredoxin